MAETGAAVVELEVVAGASPRRQETFEDLPEAREQARTDHADDLAFERLLPPPLVELGVEQPRETDVVRSVLDVRGSALPLRRVPGEVAQFDRRRLFGRTQLSQQRSMDDEIGVPPDR